MNAYKNKIAVVISFFLILLTVSGFSQTVHFNSDDQKQNIIKVADKYAREGDWKNAILQYYEFLYRYPEDRLATRVAFKIAKLYENTGEIKLARKYLTETIEKSRDTEYFLESRLRFGIFLYEQELYEENLQFCSSQTEVEFRVLNIYNKIALDEHDDINLLISNVLSAKCSASEIIGKALGDDHGSNKKAIKFGSILLSGIVPGSGRVLLGEYFDGTATFLGFYGFWKIARITSSAMTPFYFAANSAMLLYYIGNIYSTVKASRNYQTIQTEASILKILNSNTLEDLFGINQIF